MQKTVQQIALDVLEKCARFVPPSHVRSMSKGVAARINKLLENPTAASMAEIRKLTRRTSDRVSSQIANATSPRRQGLLKTVRQNPTIGEPGSPLRRLADETAAHNKPRRRR